MPLTSRPRSWPLHEKQPELLVETLVGDFAGRHRDVETVLEAAPDVFAHNVEVPRRLTPIIRDQRCTYDRSLDVLRHAKTIAPTRLTKSSVMVGVGESDEEVVETLRDLREASVDVVTIGQYLQPSPKHAKVDRYVEPAKFQEYERVGMELGFSFVASGPLVRSSYHAAEAFMATRLASAAPRGLRGSGARIETPPQSPRASRRARSSSRARWSGVLRQTARNRRGEATLEVPSGYIRMSDNSPAERFARQGRRQAAETAECRSPRERLPGSILTMAGCAIRCAPR